MEFDTWPKETCFSVPPEQVSREDLHYATVQVSKHRHVVVEYDGRFLQSILNFRTVSEPMRYLEACELAEQLTLKRRKNG